jgi:predicted S18 family serine protease
MVFPVYADLGIQFLFASPRTFLGAESAFRSFPAARACYIRAMKKILVATLLLMVFAAPAFAATHHHHRHHHHHHVHA